VELPGSVPLEFECGSDLGSHLIEWPSSHVIKCLCFYHPDDPRALRAAQDRKLLELQEAALKIGREFLVEIIASKSRPLDENTTSRVVDHLYGLGLKPDWWKLEPLVSAAAWEGIDSVIDRHDPACRGIVVLGLEASEIELGAAFDATTASRYVKGFAVGRTIFNGAAEKWLKGEIGDEAAIAGMAERFSALVTLWRRRRPTG
jgi:5-dehydro-2-deoxygluconokinase